MVFWVWTLPRVEENLSNGKVVSLQFKVAWVWSSGRRETLEYR